MSTIRKYGNNTALQDRFVIAVVLFSFRLSCQLLVDYSDLSFFCACSGNCVTCHTAPSLTGIDPNSAAYCNGTGVTQLCPLYCTTGQVVTFTCVSGVWLYSTDCSG